MKKDKEFGSNANLVTNMGKNEDKEPGKDGETKKTELKFSDNTDPEKVTANRDQRLGMLRTQSTIEERVLTPDEKSFLLCVERGDVSSSKNIIQAMSKRTHIFDLNCVDPLGRSALIISVENENLDMMEMLLEMGIKPKDALLVSIREDFVDGVEMLLRYEEENVKEGQPYSWEIMDSSVANFTADITPLILAAHRNNFEILKMLLDRGATIPMPHNVKCSCNECVIGSADDSLKFSLARINAYRALSSPSLISLSSRDPILTAFQLSDELKRLARAESQFRDEYIKLRKQVQEFVTGLVDQTRTSYELEVILNHNPEGAPWQIGDFQTLDRLKLAVQYKQKDFVAHPSVQQLLASIWYEGLPGFRRKNIFSQITDLIKLACMFPINSFIYIMAPHSPGGKFMRNPFVKFVSHSASYLFFLFLLALASQRIEHVVLSILIWIFPGVELFQKTQADWIKYERGSLPHYVEMLIIVWVQGLMWTEIKKLWQDGLMGYLSDLWNFADISSYGAFMAWIGLRGLAWLLVQKEQWDGVDPELIWTSKDSWNTFEPQLLAEAMFAAGMISSYLKLVHILSINPYLGPLQIALGKMVIDICKWMFLYILVVFAFGCGMNQLLCYYADLERQKCYSLPGGLPDFENEPDSCVSWRRFANLWETSQSLFWASFGLVDLGDFELTGIKEFTRFWGLLMFGSYSICNLIVLINMLIAMMSNSYQIIFERSDTEWKFSRSKLWMSYFDSGSTVPPPFNLIPSPKSIIRILCCRKIGKKPFTEQDIEEANERYHNVMKFVIRRYITNEQRKSEDFSITEDDIQEVRQDINSFKYELLDILKNNNMVVPNTKRGNGVVGRKSKNMERQIQKGFNITQGVEGVMEAFFTASQEEKPKDVFKRFAKIINDKKKKGEQVNRDSLRRDTGSIRRDQIGSHQASIRKHRSSLKRSLLQRGSSQQEIKMVLTRLNSEELVAFNPHLSDYAPAARRAYAKFRTALDDYNTKYKGPETTVTSEDSANKAKNRDSLRKLVIEKAKSVDSTSLDGDPQINKTAADLEKIIDAPAKSPAKPSGGVVNQGFEPDELKVKIIPPSHQGSVIDPSDDPSLKTPAASPKPSVPSTPSAKAAAGKPPTSPSTPSIPSPSAAAIKPPTSPSTPSASAETPKPPSLPSATLTPVSAATASTPSAPGSPIPPSSSATSSTPQPPKSPLPTPKTEQITPAKEGPPATPARLTSETTTEVKAAEKSPAKASTVKPKEEEPKPKSPAALPAVPKTATAEEPKGKFDPEGKSAVSGQKRTGWI